MSDMVMPMMPRRIDQQTIMARIQTAATEEHFPVPNTPWRPLSWEFTFDEDFMPLAIYKGRVDVLGGIYDAGISITNYLGIHEAPNDGQLYFRDGQSRTWVAFTEVDGGYF